MIIRDVAAGWRLEAEAPTLREALELLAQDCDQRADKQETSAREASVDATTLRQAAAHYRELGARLNATPEVGSPLRDDHKNDSDEGEEDDGRQGHEFEVGEKG